MGREKISGIYKIENIVNGKLYIGSSIDIYKRWKEHKTELENKCHHSIHLQRAWDKHGEENFKFEILEVFNGEREKLFELEKYYLDTYKCCDFTNGYNISDNPLSCGTSPPTYQDIINGKFIMSKDQFDEIIYYLCNTKLSVPKISKITGTSINSISQIYHKRQYVNIVRDLNFIKRTDIGENSSNSKLTEKDVLEIISMLINEFYMVDISKKFNISPSTIHDIYSHKSWKHLTKDIQFPKYKKAKVKARKSVSQYDLNSNFIATYESAKEAERVTGIGYKLILRVCTGKRSHTCGFKWEFAS